MTTPAADPGRVKVLLLAAGVGSRLRPLTDTTPKCLVPIVGRPLIEQWFALFAEAGLRDVLLNTHHLPEPVRAYIAQKNAGGQFRVAESYEPELLGSAGTVTATRAWADDADTVLIVYADNLSDLDVGAMLRFHAARGAPFTMMLFRAENPSACGIAQLDATDRIVEFVEKPAHPKSDLANAGVYIVSADAYREMADIGGRDLGFDVLPAFTGRMYGFVSAGYHRDIGDAASLAKAEAAVRGGALREIRARGDTRS